ncbi:TlpA family protein disulfide reductase [Flavobacterium litorale]|uniref:TlpA family protein disulfide reductase n=1 Tax=Flavobacterium litorale TaxID=2856519 RepID=A0ABX8V8U4_9FLAO|nr:TlpA disulfide reductase family protein [Flavobacterium litorale]QYJ69258.1 TlpA family protein disulfide reductase [Flavobacterium litorale]
MKKLLLLLLLTTFTYAQTDAIKLSATIENSEADSLIVYSKNNQTALKATQKGYFKGVLDVPGGFYRLLHGKEVGFLYVSTGDNLSFKATSGKIVETIAFTGDAAAENNFLNKKAKIYNAFITGLDKVPTTASTYQKMVGAMVRELRSDLEKPSIDEGFKSRMIASLAQEQKQLITFAKKKQEAKKMKGKPSAPFTYENFNGGTTSLSDLKGKYVYIDVWATWCGPCRKEIPYLKAIEAEYHNKNIAFVSISVDNQKNHSKWKRFVKKEALGGIQLIADKDWSSTFVKYYNIRSIPRFILLDTEGNIVNTDAPRPSDPALKMIFDELLN